MRRRDWADDQADELFSGVMAENDDQKVVANISKALRAAYFAGLMEMPIMVKREEKGTQVRHYQVCVPVDVGMRLTKEYVDQHGKLTFIEPGQRYPDPNPDDPPRG